MQYQNPFQPFIDHAQAQARHWLDVSRKNMTGAMDLAEPAISIRNLDDVKSLIEASSKATREIMERSMQASQQAFQETSALIKTQTDQLRTQMNGGLPSFETLFNPKTYGLGEQTDAQRSGSKRR